MRLSGLKLLRLVSQVLEIADSKAMSTISIRCRNTRPPSTTALDSLREEIGTRHIRVSVEDEVRLPGVVADPRGLRTILTNLLQVPATCAAEGGEVRLSARRIPGGVRIQIEDDGEGIDPDELPRLMRPFEQGQNALTRSTEGAGLGLPIVFLLCQAMGGGLRLTSEPGKAGARSGARGGQGALRRAWARPTSGSRCRALEVASP